MLADCARPNWDAILTHESGHAVAALELLGEVADIRLRGPVPGGQANCASYSLPDVESGCTPNPRRPLDRIIVYAAGAKAEEVLLGTTESLGFKSDLRKIEWVRDRLRRDADENHLRALRLPSESLAAALAHLPDATAQLREVDLEIDSNYQQTKDLLNRRRIAVEKIAAAALGQLEKVELLDGIILLQAEQVESVWRESQGDTPP